MDYKPYVEADKGRTKKVYTTREKQIDFAIGFGGWLVIGGILWLFGMRPSGSPYYSEGVFLCIAPVYFLSNIVALIVLAFTRRWIALGLLSVLGVNLVISLALHTSYAGVCTVPVFISP